MTWILLVLAYGLIKGMREVLKKKALEKNTTLEVLFLYTLLSFIFVLPEMRGAFHEEFSTLIVVALKSLAIFLAWIFSFNSIRFIPISLYGILDLSRVLFATLFGVLVMKETLGTGQLLGLFLVALGLLLLKAEPHKKIEKKDDKNIPAIHVFLLFLSCMLNSVSGILDKVLMTYTPISDGHLQFWYMLFLVIYYSLYVIATLIINHKRSVKVMSSDISNSVKTVPNQGKIEPAKSSSAFNLKTAIKNPWIWLLAILFVIADRCLFIANADPDSKVTIMTLIKQSCCFVTILAGKFIFHEKKILHKFLCACVIVAGIIVSVVLK
ncbi:MAG: EamA family transporter [Lachnospiraceae bacterium]|nr:EamA family transporter [Lachnospiraceae bacterium]